MDNIIRKKIKGNARFEEHYKITRPIRHLQKTPLNNKRIQIFQMKHFPSIDHLLGHKTSFSNFKEIKVTQGMFFTKCNAIELEISKKEI